MDYEVLVQSYFDDFIGEDIKRMEEKCETLQEILADAVLRRSVPQFWGEMKPQTEKFEAVANMLGINEDTEKKKVYYYAVLRTIIQLSHSVSDKVEKIKDFGEYSSYTHLFPVLEMLYKNESLPQSTIARRLGISAQSMSNFFSRTDRFELWKSQKMGKFQCYSINFKGKQVYKEYRKQKLMDDQQELDEMLINLLDFISKEMEARHPDIDRIISGMNLKYGKSTAVFSSPALKFKLNAIFMKRGIEYRKREEIYRYKMEPLWNRDMENVATSDRFELPLYWDDADSVVIKDEWR